MDCPWAAGDHNYLANSVFIIIFLRFLFAFIWSSFLLSITVCHFSTSVMVVFADLFAKLLFADKIRRYGTVLLFCLMPTFNLYGRSVFQPYLLAPFLMMSF